MSDFNNFNGTDDNGYSGFNEFESDYDSGSDSQFESAVGLEDSVEYGNVGNYGEPSMSNGFNDFDESAVDLANSLNSLEDKSISKVVKKEDNPFNGVLNYKEFEAMCKEDCGISVHSLHKYVVNYYMKNRSQTSALFLDLGNSFVDNDMLSCFRGFPIITKGEFKTIDSYIIFVDPSDVEESYFEEVEKNLPTGVSPTHVCILSNELEIIERCFEDLLKINSNLLLTNYTNSYNVSNTLNDKVNKVLSNTPKLSIAKYCSELRKLYGSVNSYEFYKRFDEMVTEILELGKSKVVYFGGDYSNNELEMYKYLVTECSLRNLNFRFYIEDEYVPEVASTISNCLFDPSNQMVEDVDYFFKNFPRVCLEYKSNFLVTNVVTDKKMILKLKYVPLSDISSARLKSTKIDASLLRIIPINTYFKLETDDMDFNISEELRLRSFINDLYTALELEHEIINLTNLVFFELNGIEYVGCNLGYDVSVKFNSIMKGLFPTQREINNINDFSSFVYLPIFLNRDKFLKSILNGGKMNLPAGAFAMVKSNVRKNTSIFKHTSCVYTPEMNSFENSLYLIGMCSKESRIVRDRVVNELNGIMGLSSVRKKIDSFGVFNSISNNVIEV